MTTTNTNEPTKARTPRSQSKGVQELKSGRFRARYLNPDKTRITLGTFDTRKEAEDAILLRKASHLRGQWTPNRGTEVPLSAVWTTYLSDEENDTESGAVHRKRAQFERRVITGEGLTRAEKAAIKDAREKAEAAGRRFDPASVKHKRTVLGDYPITTITLPTVRAWVREMITEGLATSTIESHWDMLSALLKFAVEEGHLPEHPLEGRTPKISSSKRRDDERAPFFLTLREMVAMTQAALPRDALFMETILWSGCRQSEVLALDGPDVQVRAGLVRIDEATTTDKADRNKVVLKNTKTKSSTRRVPLPRPIVEALARRDDGPGMPLFPSRKDPAKHWDDRRASDAWTYARTRVGGDLVGNPDHDDLGRQRPAREHDARGTVTSLLFSLGASLPEVMTFVGHGDSKTTLETYATVQEWDQFDPLVLEVKAMGLPLAEAWTILYTRAWETYGDDAWTLVGAADEGE
ncbi:MULTISPECIES: tyrosine-type recombinase/integrase [unclassified Nocardioides]|uniref:tyrosine-type recombinase/integrase n=1 Tax=unclassified Nocardioides TaxID=2615069 RepID=UPI00301460A5